VTGLHQVTLLAVAVSLVVPAAGLWRARCARASALLLTLTALALGAGVVLDATAGASVTDRAWLAASLLLGPLALVLFPVARWRDPVDFVAVVTVTAAGLLSLVAPEAVVTSATVVLIAVAGHLWWRLEQGPATERRALTWMALAFGSSFLVTGLVSFAADSATGTVGAEIFFGVVGPALYVGATRPDLADVRALVVPVVTYLTAAVVYLAVFIGAASVIEESGGGTRPTVAVLAVCATVLATTFHPMQVVFRGVVDELLFGVRPDPLDAAGLVSGRIGDDPILALRAIREALLLPYAALRVDDEVSVASGTRTTHTEVRPLPSDTGRLLELEVGLRTGEVALSVTDRQVLDIAIPLLAQSLRASALAADLQQSRQQTIATREEERRRLRRDLHDGLGPRLTGIAFTTDAARNLARSDPAAAERLLEALRAETTAAIDSIRELVYAMRPPALDELGLAAAVTQAATAMRCRSGVPLRTTVRTDRFEHLPAAVEVAAYRIAVEALTNVARHTDSPDATVELSCTGDVLVLEVRDRAPAAGPWRAGVGLSSMRERAEELGGTLAAGGNAGGGCVRAELPLGQSSSR
jgi:two-component system NarL family sensor kinase